MTKNDRTTWVQPVLPLMTKEQPSKTTTIKHKEDRSKWMQPALPLKPGKASECATSTSAKKSIEVCSQRANLLDVPLEIRTEILSYLLPVGETFDLSVKARTCSGRRIKPYFQDFLARSWFGSAEDFDARGDHKNIFDVCTQLRDECLGILDGNSTPFWLARTYDLPKLSLAMDTRALAVGLRNLEIRVDFLLKIHRMKVWMGVLDVLGAQLTQLRKLALTTSWLFRGGSSGPMPQTSGNTRGGQEQRCLLRLGAWVTARHPLLKLLVWRNWVQNWDRHHVKRLWWQDPDVTEDRVEIFAPSSRPQLKLIDDTEEELSLPAGEAQDFILDSTRIRIVDWDALANRDPSSFNLPSTMTSSEFYECNPEFEQVHKQGYLSQQDMKQKGLRGSNCPDALIARAKKEIARNKVTGAVRRGPGLQVMPGRKKR